jgi:glycyl-radical enzyme activating protein
VAVVFDIQRACLHDGPGIRTTVFLKGCPLRCLWCHNPEGISGDAQLFYNTDRCVGCGRCAEACRNGVHHCSGNVHALELDKCTLCGQCISVCDHSALRLVGKEMSVEEVLKEVLADTDFYESSGGGITLSGGEPLWQLEFSLALLRKSREVGIHTCIETSGYADSRSFKRVFGLVDLMLFDYKVSNSALHEKYTGVPNKLILQNLDLAYQTGVPIVLRCPIISDVNDSESHFRAIRGMEEKYPRLKGIEIMPYHSMGVAKLESIGCNRLPLGWPTADKEMKNSWLARLSELGCTKVALG